MAAGEIAARAGHETLERALERLISAARGRPATVAAVARTPSPFVTLSAAEVLAVTLTDGTSLRVFLKHLGSEEADHPDKRRRDREVLVYERLLREPQLPVVRYYGSRPGEDPAHREVFLEYVDDWNLTCHHLEHWFDAARRLADLHSHFAARADELGRCDFLLRFDEPYLHAWARRAIESIRGQSDELAADLGRVVDRYDRVAELLAGAPPTLVHNDLAPKNVIADRSTSPARYCFVDWEMAGVGCGLLDLVHLKHGLGGDDDRRMCEAYFDQLAAYGCDTPEPDRARLLAAADLHATVHRLAFVRQWGVKPETVAQWVLDVRKFYDVIRAGQRA